MCGIAGTIMHRGLSVEGAWAERFSAVLQHRGPDDNGWLTLQQGRILRGRGAPASGPADVLLLHRRLSILDLSEGGWQPMSTRDGRFHVTFNGEIYNYLELRRELEILGHCFESQCDTEVLLASYAQWGANAFRRFVGMFAFGLVDSRENTLVLVRDFFGIKPLYYAEWRDGTAFASEIKALLELPGVDRRVAPQRLYDYLRFGLTDHGAETLLQAVHQVPAAHYLRIAIDGRRPPQLERYWSPGEVERSSISMAQAAERLRELFLDSVRLHLRSDVPVGAALSGGLDSSAIVMAMRTVEPSLDLRTYSYIADDANLSEESWIDLVGHAAGARVHKVRPNSQDLLTELRSLVRAQDEPFGGTSIYAQHRVFAAARADGVSVMLDGQGADEFLGGYRYYLAARLVTLWRQRRFGELARFLRAAGSLPGITGLGLMLRAADFMVPPDWQETARRVIGKDGFPRWLRREWFAERAVQPPVLCYTTEEEVLHTHLRRTLRHQSLPHLLRYEDRNSMAFSVESRVPFLTPALVDFVLSLPEELIVSPNGESKAVFRQAMRGIVPDRILGRKDKIGFATPQGAWLRESANWVDEVLSSDAARQIPPLDLDGMRARWAESRTRGGSVQSVWQWVNLIEWSEQVGARYE